MDKPIIYRGDGYQPDPINETTSTILADLIPKIEAAARLGADVELITERVFDTQYATEINPTVRRRFRLKVYPPQPDSDAREALANIALQHERRQAAFEGIGSDANR